MGQHIANPPAYSYGRAAHDFGPSPCTRLQERGYSPQGGRLRHGRQFLVLAPRTASPPAASRKYYPIRSRDLKGLFLQARYYAYGVFTGGTNPFPATAKEKFNPLQKIAYLSTMLVFTPVIVISGILYSNIMLFRDAILLMGGVRVLDAIHLVTAYIFFNYLIVHVYMSTMGRTPWSHVLEMFTGRHGRSGNRRLKKHCPRLCPPPDNICPPVFPGLSSMIR